MLRKATLILLALVLAVPFVALAQTYNEAPMLAARVAAGELPPVDQRLPENPMVVEPFHEIGQHGGTLRTYALTFNWGPPPIGTQNQQSGPGQCRCRWKKQPGAAAGGTYRVC